MTTSRTMTTKRYLPKLTDIRKIAARHGISADRVKYSDRKDKKMMVLFDGRWVHFGHPDYEDFTIHKDRKRWQNYVNRSEMIKGTHTKGTAAWCAFYLLWPRILP